MNQLPPISIIIPVYNTPSSQLRLCMKSVYSQTYQNYEVIIINDASNNKDTIDFLKDINNPKVRIINLESNGGISVALNIGLNEAKNEYVARMDADDMMNPHRLQKQIQYLVDNPNVDMLSTGLNYCTENNGNIEINPNAVIHPHIITNEIAKKSRWFVNHPTVIYKKSKILSLGGYDESLKGLPEDYDLWIRMLNNDMVIHNLQESLLYLRLSNNSLSKSFKGDLETFFTSRQKSIKAMK